MSNGSGPPGDGEGAPDPQEVIGPEEPPAEEVGPAGGGGGRSQLISALRSTHPNPPIQEVGNLRDIRQHWQAYGLRGLEKMAGADDAEAWVDLLKMAVGATLENYDGDATSEDAEEEARSDGMDVHGDVPDPTEL